MEYLVYLSQNKIDMLYEQEYRNNDETETEGEIKLGFFSLRRKRKKDGQVNRFQKLERVTEALSGRTGSPFDEEVPSYITDTLMMDWRTLTYTKNAIYWLGEDMRNGITTKVLLIGSAKNVIGEETGGSDETTHSLLLHFLNAFRKEFELPESRYSETFIRISENGEGVRVDAKDISASEIIDTLGILRNTGPSMFAGYKFLAKCLSSEERRNEYGTERFIIATPLYVSLAD